MACKTVCRLCPRLILSNAVNFGDGVLEVNLPAGSYGNGEKYCIVVAQSIPDEATRNAPVFVTIGDGTVSYPLVTQCCRQVTQNQLQTRWKYTTILRTTPTGGSFVVVGRLPPTLGADLPAIDGTDPTTDTGGGATT